MNKSGVAVLLLSAFGFLVALILFFSTVDKIQPVGNSTFLGESEAEVLGTYVQGEKLMVFLENAALESSGSEVFGDSFSGYLVKANMIFGTDLEISDFDITSDKNFLRASAKKDVVLSEGGVRYTLNPSFIVYLV